MDRKRIESEILGFHDFNEYLCVNINIFILEMTQFLHLLLLIGLFCHKEFSDILSKLSFINLEF